MHALSGSVLEPRVLTRLRHQRVSMLASAEVLRRTRHPRAAQQLLAAAEDLGAEIDFVEAGGDPRRRARLVCGCTHERACPDASGWAHRRGSTCAAGARRWWTPGTYRRTMPAT